MNLSCKDEEFFCPGEAEELGKGLPEPLRPDAESPVMGNEKWRQPQRFKCPKHGQ